MRAYSDVYLGDVVENQGKLFDYVANTYPDKDTEDFINAYMTSKTRQSIDQAKAYVNTMDAKELWEYIARRYGIVLEEWNHDIDHVHVMFRAQPKTELSKFINAYKSASSRLLKKEYPEIREKLWKEAFWSQSFCLLTAGGAPVEVIRQYIETQGEKKH